jgi:hypothetical protein
LFVGETLSQRGLETPSVFLVTTTHSVKQPF